LKFGSLELDSNAFLAPMAEITDYAFRNIAKKYGAGLTFTQMVSAEGVIKNNFNTPQWNPFKDIIKPTNTVVIKPNFVLSKHDNGGDLFSIITHPSIIRTMVDYVYIALAGKGKIIIADATQMDCDFKELFTGPRTQVLTWLCRTMT